MLHRTTQRFIAYFFRAYPVRSAILVVMLVMSGLAEAVGVASLLPLLVLGAQLVIFLALLGVRQRLVGFVDRLEFLLGLFVARVHIRMVLARQFTVRLFNGLFVRIGWNTQNFVIILEVHIYAQSLLYIVRVIFTCFGVIPNCTKLL